MSDALTGSALANEISKIIAFNPEHHDQETWFHVWDDEDLRNNSLRAEDVKVVHEGDLVKVEFSEQISCDTTMCVAGWACILNGYNLTVETSPDGCKEVHAVKDGQSLLVEERAMVLLGLDDDDADRLFCSTNDYEAREALSHLSQGWDIDWEDIDYLDTSICDCGCNA